MGTPRSYTVTTVKGLSILADRVPFIETEDLTRVRSGSSGTTFELMTNGRKVPRGWQSWLIPLESVIHVHDVRLPGKPLISYVVTDIRRSCGGKIQIDAVTLEFFLMNDCYLGDMDFEEKDLVSEIGVAVGMVLESEGVGWGMTARATPSGEIRTRYILSSDAVTPAAFFEKEGIAWNIWCELDADGNYVSFIDLELPQAVNTGTHVAFELRKNIGSYDYSAPASAGVLATRLIVLGDGSGGDQVRSMALTDTERELRVPRRTVRLSVAGLSTVEDCNLYAEYIKKDFFARRDAITLTARDNGSTTFADIHDMKATALVNIDDPDLMFVHHTIIGGWSVGRNLHAFTPTLLLLGAGSVKFPKSVDPAIDTSLDDVKNDVNDLKSRDDLKNGKTWTSADGTRTYVGPDGYKRTDADGNETGNRSDEVYVIQHGGYSVAIMKDARGIDFRYAPAEGVESEASLRLDDAATGIPGEQALTMRGPGASSGMSSSLAMRDNGYAGLTHGYGNLINGGFYGNEVGGAGKTLAVKGSTVTTTGTIIDNGNVTVKGSHTVEGSKQFGMPDPSNPARYLRHAAVEAPVNGVMYWGRAQAGSDGFVTVILPDYFDALTVDAEVFVQVKSRCTFVPFPSDVINGEFTIESDPGVIMSWHVLATRQWLDADGVDRLAYDAVSYREIRNDQE